MGGQAPAGSANVAVGAAAVSLDGFIANDNTHPGPLFDWFGKGEVAWSLPGAEGGPQLPGLGRLHAQPVPRRGGKRHRRHPHRGRGPR